MSVPLACLLLEGENTELRVVCLYHSLFTTRGRECRTKDCNSVPLACLLLEGEKAELRVVCLYQSPVY